MVVVVVQQVGRGRTLQRGDWEKKSSVLTVFIEMNTDVQTSDSEFSFRFSKGKSFCVIVAPIICETTSVINCLTELLQVHQLI